MDGFRTGNQGIKEYCGPAFRYPSLESLCVARLFLKSFHHFEFPSLPPTGPQIQFYIEVHYCIIFIMLFQNEFDI